MTGCNKNCGSATAVGSIAVKGASTLQRTVPALGHGKSARRSFIPRVRVGRSEPGCSRTVKPKRSIRLFSIWGGPGGWKRHFGARSQLKARRPLPSARPDPLSRTTRLSPVSAVSLASTSPCPSTTASGAFIRGVLTTGDQPLWREDLMNDRGMPVIGLGKRCCEHANLPLQWTPYVMVADVAASVKSARELGGRELMHGMNDEGWSQWAVLGDPNGAAFRVIPWWRRNTFIPRPKPDLPRHHRQDVSPAST